eukprot:GFUD01041928.1.p1 GENE.GFUD01041928.1~~GFUD01041928.1.p1  ORF type:complete len:203 (+),score=52.04 GFUD01041928.1:94-702(+)
MTVKISHPGSDNRKRKYQISFPTILRRSKESTPKLKREKVSVSTSPDPPPASSPPTAHPTCPMGTPVSIPATVCYEGEGLLVVQIQWRGKNYVGTLLNSDNMNRGNIMFEKIQAIENNCSPSEQELNVKSDQCGVKEEKDDLTENKVIVNEHKKFGSDYEKGKKKKKNYSKGFKCDFCDKRYTWYSGLSNHKRFLHNKTKEA